MTDQPECPLCIQSAHTTTSVILPTSLSETRQRVRGSDLGATVLQCGYLLVRQCDLEEEQNHNLPRTCGSVRLRDFYLAVPHKRRTAQPLTSALRPVQPSRCHILQCTPYTRCHLPLTARGVWLEISRSVTVPDFAVDVYPIEDSLPSTVHECTDFDVPLPYTSSPQDLGEQMRRAVPVANFAISLAMH